MKKIITLAMLVAAAVGLQAADVSYSTKTFPTFSNAASTGTNVALVIPCVKQTSVALQVEAMADAAGAYTLTIPFQRSVDKLNWNTALETIALSFNGVTKQVIVTNIPTWGAGYIKIPYTTNSHATINGTNVVIKWGEKTGL